MQKRIRFKSLLLDFLVILLCLSAASFFSYLFWQDLNSFTVRGDKTEIGTISFKHNVAQRKFNDRVVWERVASGTKLYYGDTIRTADLSEAVLTLTDGTVIDLGEKTMIQVGSNASGGIQIAISGGDIQLDSTAAVSNIELKLDDGSVVNVDAGSSLLATSDSENGMHNIAMKNGSAQLTTEKGESASLSQGESANFENGGDIQKGLAPAESQTSSAAARFNPDLIKNLEQISPTPSASFKYRTSLPRITFRWNESDYAERYRLLISSTQDMKNLVAEFEILGTFSAIDSLDEGDYWWQVIPYYSVGNLGYAKGSEVRPFKIIKSTEIRRPELSSPADNAQLIYKENIYANFIWKSEIKGAEYELSLARDYDFNNVIYSVTTKETRHEHEFSPSELRDGTYYWKILRKSSEPDDKNPVSEIRVFRVSRYVPQDNKLLYPPENSMIEGSKIAGTAFMWKLSEEFSRKSLASVLQISSSQNFSSIQIERTTASSVLDNMILPSGIYWWRVGVRDENGALVGLTPSRSFTVLSELTPPEILEPAMNQELMIYNYSPVTLSWKAIPDATHYAVKILDSKGNVVKQNDSVRDTSIKYVLNDGSYTFSVQAIASATRISGTNERIFSVRSPSNILAQSPLSGSRISGLTALRNPVIFTWLPGKDKASVYKFILSKIQRDGSSKIINTIETSKNTISLNRLEAGSYSWKIAGSTANGIPLDSKTMTFVVENVPELESPVLVSPSQNFLMDGSYLKKNRTIEFTWKEVSGATAYDFVLYKKNASGSRQVVYSEKKTKASNARIKDLSILDVGAFEWTVTPYSYAKDGFLEQKGRTSTFSFRIDFDSPTRVEAVQPGKLYGN